MFDWPNLPADTLVTGDALRYGDYLVSLNGCFNATISTNGNLVVYRISTNSVLWNLNYPGQMKKGIYSAMNYSYLLRAIFIPKPPLANF